MPDQTPTIVLVHGAFAESASWNPVIEQLHAQSSSEVIAAANPLRSVAGDAASVRDTIAGIDEPVLLVGHSYGGFVITEAAADNDAVVGLVYVGAFAPDHGETAFDLSTKFPGSSLGEALTPTPLASGGVDLAIAREKFHHQFAADVPAEKAALMAVTQRPVTQGALTDALPADVPAWKQHPSWFVFGDQDLNIPVALQRFMADRAGAKGVTEVAGASHAISVSAPDPVTATILDALGAV